MNGPKILFKIPILGGIPVSETVVNSWLVIGVIFLICIFLTHNMQKVPKGKQVLAEKYVMIMSNLVKSTMGADKMSFTPYIGTIFIYSLLCSLSSLTSLRPPTADLNTTLGWALVTVALIYINAIRRKGVVGWLKSFLEPVPLLLPINLISEVANPVSLSFRHFGNIAAGLVITSLIYGALGSLSSIVTGGLIDIPFLQIGLPAVLSIYFDLLTSFLQAFIFSMLTMVLVSSAMD